MCILNNGLPPLREEIGNKSESSKNESHPEAEIKVSEFEFIDNLSLREMTNSLIWGAYRGVSEILTYASEATIATYVWMVMTEFIYSAGQEGKISLVQEMQFHNQRPDAWIIRSNGLPVGILEIKKPSTGIMNERLLAGQVYDYLNLLKSFYGLKQQFAIVTTYEEWRFFWLPGSDNIAKLTKVDDPVPSPLIQQLPRIPTWGGKDPTVVKTIPHVGQGPVTTPRKVYTSKIFGWGNQQLTTAMASMLLKMASFSRCKVNLVDTDRAYIEMTEDSWKWTVLPTGLTEVRFGPAPRDDAKKFIFLAYLGSGAEGLVWLATTESGTGCVVKLTSNIKPPFPKSKKRKQTFDKAMQAKMMQASIKRKEAFQCLYKEAQNWKNIWDIDVRVKSVGGQPALIMPYFQTKEPQINSEYRGAVTEAIKHMVQKGYKHGDLAPRHVGLYKKGKVLHAVLIDLSNVHCVNTEDTAVVIEEMMKKVHLTDA